MDASTVAAILGDKANKIVDTQGIKCQQCGSRPGGLGVGVAAVRDVSPLAPSAVFAIAGPANLDFRYLTLCCRC